MTDTNVVIDESLYSRQLYVLGEDAMKRMGKKTVVVDGLDGVGVEIAKNIILNGVYKVILYDTAIVTLNDLATNFYCTLNDVNKITRADASLRQLRELNPYVLVESENKKSRSDLVKECDVYVTTDVVVAQQADINNMCRTYNKKYIHAESRGVFGKIFCDFGEEFTVYDVDGEPETSVPVDKLSINDNKVTVVCTEPHNLETGKQISLSELVGSPELNGNEYTVNVEDRYTLTFNVDFNISKYEKGGLVTNVKKPVVMNFKTIDDTQAKPPIMSCDWLHPERPSVLHSAFKALGKFKMENNRYPAPYNKNDLKEFIECFKCVNGDIPKEEEKTVEHFCFTSSGQIIAMTGVIGAIAAQEVVKACTGKFSPINQYMYFDSIESLPEGDFPEDEFVSETRYKAQVAVIGKTLNEKLLNAKTFVVGSGAIGCELMKYFVMSGVGCGKDGLITITDMDTIEKSNLNRQFLFRPKDVKSAKSICAARACKEMNPDANIKAQENKVGLETEHIYDEKFFSGLAFVANALDNVDARRYMDRRCLLYGTSLLESGTLGTKGNTQIIVAGVTESYETQADPPEKSIPLCTIKNFPKDITHTTQWARDGFEGTFVNSVQDAIKYLRDPNEIKKLPPDQLGAYYDNVMCVLVDNYAHTYDDCVKVAFNKFCKDYDIEIQDLLNKFPPDHMTGEGTQTAPFWTGDKRCPSVTPFDVNNNDHMEYIRTYARLWADVYGIKNEFDIEKVKQFIQSLERPKYNPTESGSVAVTDSQELERKKAEQIKERDLSYLPNVNNFKGLVLTPHDFEKDDDSNGHIDFVTISSNLRATNYKIKNGTRHQIKGIAGKIIPAIATTTSIVAGLVSLEMFKILLGKNKIEQYRNTFLNLAIPLIAYSEPGPAPVTKIGEKKYSIWDSLTVRGDCSVKELIDNLTDQIGFDVDMVLYGDMIVYAFYLPPDDKNNIFKMKVSERIKQLCKNDTKANMVRLNISIDYDDDPDAEVPNVKFYF